MGIAGDGGTQVSGPICRPSRFGLLSVAEVVSAGQAKWLKGMEWDELECGYDVGIVNGQCPALPEQHKTALRGFDTRFADPFAVYAGWECSAIGATAEAWDIAEELLTRNWQRGLERAFWDGLDQDDNPVVGSLPSLDIVDLTPAGGAVSLVDGVAILEGFAGDCSDCEPTVHAMRTLAPYFADHALSQRDGDVNRLAVTGTLLSVGSGYLSTFPGAEDIEPLDGEAWIVVTGSVKITQGDTFFTPGRGDLAGAVDRSVNDVRVYAERFAAFQVGCCVGAVRVVAPGVTADESS